MNCAFTGHRPKSFSFRYNESDPRCVLLKKDLKNEILNAISNGINTFYSGGALGVDTWAAEIILELKKEYDIKLIMALPGKSQPSRWPEKSKERYNSILNAADEIIYMYDGAGEFPMKFLNIRNDYMVEHADLLIAIYNGSKSGTGNAVSYARKLNKKTVIIDPNKYEVI